MNNELVTLTRITGGGQSIGTLASGKKIFLWGALPGETTTFRVTKKKSSMVEGIADEIKASSNDRVDAIDPESYLSTSPWQIMSEDAESRYKAQLINDAFALHSVTLPGETTMYTDGQTYHYRNKVEFSWWGDSDEHGNETLDLAFFRRASKGKIPVQDTSLARDEINTLAQHIRDLLRTSHISARDLKTLMIRCDQQGNCVWQLYVKETSVIEKIDLTALTALPAQGGEIIYSDPKSPASRITERLHAYGDIVLTDTILGIPFRYATEGFFQVNVPVYEQSLTDMKQWVVADKPVIDMYSGVGTIGLTIGGDSVTLIESNEHAVREMYRNIKELGIAATPVLAPSETALEHINAESTIIVDPPRAGLHADVTERLLETTPQRIIYLSCNPVTQARDVERLLVAYKMTHHKGYNFFPRTPHIEHLVVLDLIK